ncbi:ATPase, T2SS/T4P/T4SS family [candidate division CSSED10-310 bacterium]|uniref:ATPase, T2SS/T4P/T4SS family n=1 Tax=candidate division CSSED10-310 bacterium TaxID=2855610 RepID=A0ABV6YTV4_UNCC1
MFNIVIRDRRKNEKFFEIPADDVVTIGREDNNTLVIKSPSVSRLHAKLIKQDNKMLLEDHSSNGTFLNNKRVMEKAWVKVGDTIVVGEHALKLIAIGDSSYIPEKVAGQEPASEKAGQIKKERETHLVSEDELQPAPKTTPAKISTIYDEGGIASVEVEIVSTLPQPHYSAEQTRILLELSEKIHNRLLENIDLKPESGEIADADLTKRTETELKIILEEFSSQVPSWVDVAELEKKILDEVLRLGPLNSMLDDPKLTAIMVINKDTIYIEKKGRIELTDASFSTDLAVLSAIRRIIGPAGKIINDNQPVVNVRLEDGSRVTAIIAPLALSGPCLTIKKSTGTHVPMADLIGFRMLNKKVAKFLDYCVKGRRNIFISGETGAGKTTLLNALLAIIPYHERIVTIENRAELHLGQPHVIRLQAKQDDQAAERGYNIRELLLNALDMRPERIVVDQCLGDEALLLLKAMNTGHNGTLITGYGTSPTDVLTQLESLVQLSETELSGRAIRHQIATAVHVIVHLDRFSDGSRKVTYVTEIIDIEDSGAIITEDIYHFTYQGLDHHGKVMGELNATGYLPSFGQQLSDKGIPIPEELFED